MKTLAKIYRWIIISVILQFIVLIFLNNFYFAQDSSFRLTSINFGEERKLKKEVEIPNGSLLPKVSFDGMYSSYIKDGKLQIVDMYTGLISRTIQDESMEISYYKWLPDRNIVIYGMNRPASKNGRIKVGTLVLETEVEHSYPEITGLAEGSIVEDIELSTLTNNVYVKIKTSQYWAEIYKLNIMNRLTHVKGVKGKTVIAELNLNDTLLYMSEGSQLKERNGNNDSTDYHSLEDNQILLATDCEDRIYICEGNGEGEIENIRVGNTLEVSVEQWTEYKLDQPDEVENLFITFGGSIYRLDKSQGALHDLKTGRVVQYEGQFAEITDNFIVYLDGSKLKLSSLKGRTST